MYQIDSGSKRYTFNKLMQKYVNINLYFIVTTASTLKITLKFEPMDRKNGRRYKYGMEKSYVFWSDK